CFVGGLRRGQSVAGLVVTRFSIYQDYVAMRAVTLHIFHNDLPGSAWRIKTQGDLAPLTERADDFDHRRSRRLIGRNRPTEHFSEAGPLFAVFGPVMARNCRYVPG